MNSPIITRVAFVEALPRRTAHALYALTYLQSAGGMEIGDVYGPYKAREIVVYDEESLSAQQTSAALRDAQKRGLAVSLGGGLWTPTNVALDLHTELEDRFLKDTER